MLGFKLNPVNERSTRGRVNALRRSDVQMNYHFLFTLMASFMGQHGAHLGPTHISLFDTLIMHSFHNFKCKGRVPLLPKSRIFNDML